MIVPVFFRPKPPIHSDTRTFHIAIFSPLMAANPPNAAELMEEVATLGEEAKDDSTDLDVWALLADKKSSADSAKKADDDDDTEPPSPLPNESNEFNVKLPAELADKLEKLEKEGSLTGLLQCSEAECLGYYHLSSFFFLSFY